MGCVGRVQATGFGDKGPASHVTGREEQFAQNTVVLKMYRFTFVSFAQVGKNRPIGTCKAE